MTDEQEDRQIDKILNMAEALKEECLKLDDMYSIALAATLELWMAVGSKGNMREFCTRMKQVTIEMSNLTPRMTVDPETGEVVEVQ